MERVAVRVLLLGRHTIHLLSYLEKRGCCHWHAKSAEEGVALFRQHKIQLVLSTSPVGQAIRMASLLGDSNCSVFCALAVEHGCLWLPLMSNGKKCLGKAALRPNEFLAAIDRLLHEVAASESPARATPEENFHEYSIALEVVS
jgi:hypothetical protein